MVKYPYPCYGCEQRSVNCHSTCEKYLEAKAAHKEEKEKRTKLSSAEAYWARTLYKCKEFKIKEKMRRR